MSDKYAKTTVCLNMLVRNEAAIIGRCLESIKDHIDRWLIVDTGSNDSTQMIINDVLAEIPGQLIQRQWRDFGRNRTEAIELGAGQSDYVLIMDADEIFEKNAEFSWPPVGSPGYLIETGRQGRLWRKPRLLDNRRSWRFNGPVFESIDEHECESMPLIHGIRIIDLVDGARNQDPHRLKRDALALEEAALDIPGNTYLTEVLGTCYADLGDWQMAARWLERRIALGGASINIWYAWYLLGKSFEMRAQSTDAMAAYSRAFDVRPEKAEPLLAMARLCRQSGEYHRARELAKVGMETPMIDLHLYTEPDCYDYLLPLEYAWNCRLLGDFNECLRVAEPLLIRPAPTSEAAADTLALVSAARNISIQTQQVAVPEISSIRRSEELPKLTVGMATYDDYDGVYFTVMSLLLFHAEILDRIEILVIDNNPGGRCAQALKALEDRIGNLRYLAIDRVRGTAVRDLIFREADSAYVLCLDSHVLLIPDSLKLLLRYFDDHPDCMDLLQGPLQADNLDSIKTHFEPTWNEGMYGTWGYDERGGEIDAEPFEIPMQGLGLFACRNDAWLGFNPRFRGFGGEEGYIHEKFRQHGRRTLCLPFLRWAHRFERPMGPPYANTWEDRLRNYLIGFRELGLDSRQIEDHFYQIISEKLGVESAKAILETARDQLNHPMNYFDGIYCVNLDRDRERWNIAKKRFDKLGFGDRVRRVSGIESHDNQSIGQALTHRMIIAEAKKDGFLNVMIFDDNVAFGVDMLDLLALATMELESMGWNLFYWGGGGLQSSTKAVEHCKRIFGISDNAGVECRGLAYHHSIFEQILSDIPADIAHLAVWLNEVGGFDQYLCRLKRRFIANPPLLVD